MLALELHYLGDAELNKSAAAAEAALTNLHYKNETAFSFEHYITRMTELFRDLEDAGEPRTERMKVQMMLQGIKSTNAEVIAAKTLVRSQHSDSYADASATMSSQVSLIFPSTGKDIRRKRRIGEVNSDRRGGRGRGRYSGRGRGRGRGGRGGRNLDPGNCVLNGVNISDPTRDFSQEEWQKLRDGGHIHTIRELRSRSHRSGGRGRGREGNRNRSVHAVEQSNNQAGEENTNSIVNNANQPNADNQTLSRGGQNGTGFGSGRYGGRWNE